MSLPSNGRNHNQRPVFEKDNNDVVLAGLEQTATYNDENGTVPDGVNPKKGVDFADSVDYDSVNPETGINSHASAYDDLDDYVYRQTKKRHRSRHHHHRSSSAPLLFRKKSSKHHRSRKRLKKWQKVSLGIISGILALIILAVGSLVYLNIMGRQELTNNENLTIDVPDQAEGYDNGMYITYKGVQYKYNENVTSVLCMGIDRETFGNIDGNVGTGGNADAIFMITIDLETGETNLINISRETMTDIGIYSVAGRYIETVKAQLCLAYAYGDGAQTSCRNQLVAVKKLFYNIPINTYLSLDLQGIGAINDTMGGITVVSPETIDSFVAGETYNLRGSLAQSFVRARSHATIEGNNLRMQRQKIYLESFANKLLNETKKDLSAPINLFNASKPYVCTNLDASRITYLAINAIRGGYDQFEIKTVPGKVKEGKKYAEFYVDEDEFFEMFLSVYYKPVENFN